MLLRRINIRMIGVVVALLLTAACTGGPPTLSESARDLAVEEIMSFPEILGAAVGQEGIKLTLAVVVPFGSEESAAKAAGDNFVRMVKSFGPEPAPGEELGTGIFDYFVTVVYPDKTVIIKGAKVSSSPHIIWPQVLHPQNLPQVFVVPNAPLSAFLPNLPT